MTRGQTWGRWLLSLFYFVAGVLHLVTPAPFAGIMPPWVPAPGFVVAATGVAEIAGALALVQPWSVPLRKAGGIGLALYSFCVWPANFQHMWLDMAKADGGAGLGYHVPRLAFQPVLIWLALWAADVIRWSFTAHAAKARK
ncbi:DoxX family protein [Novosphingobium aquae]|uniref:DoxX family protein n=1 Tax=Novosphingobium aquae TaxID=3133435 RepID=A0ABU8SAK1_9SPHN